MLVKRIYAVSHHWWVAEIVRANQRTPNGSQLYKSLLTTASETIVIIVPFFLKKKKVNQSVITNYPDWLTSHRNTKKLILYPDEEKQQGRKHEVILRRKVSESVFSLLGWWLDWHF